MSTFVDVGKIIGVVGATGAVGAEMVDVLSRRDFPVKELKLFASRGHLGRRKTDIKLRNVQKRLRNAARRARRDQVRTKHEISVQKEGQRLKG